MKPVQKQFFCSAGFLARVLLCFQPLLLDEYLCATSDGPTCGSTVGKAAALLHVSFVVELVCEEGGLGHREMVSAHHSAHVLLFSPHSCGRAAARGLILNMWGIGAVAVPLLQ